MKRNQPQEDTGRVLAVAVLMWGIAVGAATVEGVFARLSDGTFTALALFAALYAPATYRIDRRLREFLLARPPRHVAAAVLTLDAVLIAAFLAHAPWPMFAFFGLPLAIAAQLALVERLSTSAQRSSPGARPAAT